ncbi:cytochrome P450 [Aspergillus pseudoustus]|uniref:Cytochrome P450 n=1 Tax=Aspergillus pseudoustus TaxID=1810923 RepID=A0ABR4K3U4_9EURO
MIAPSRRLRLLTLLTLSPLLLALLWLNTVYKGPGPVSWRAGGKTDLTVPNNARRITKVSMLYGNRNTLYERALQSHKRHAERWGYGMEVLRNEISVGYWNKPGYLLSLVVREMTKKEGERVDWFMWVDADSAVINPSVPLEIFLPPSPIDDIHLIATKDHRGLNTGIFFLHVHQWTIDLLIESLGYPIYNPSIDLGVQVDQSAMEKVIKGSRYQDNITYLPRTWINTYEWAHAYEGEKGNYLVHFPGLGEQRWAHMERWLDMVERTPEKWEVPVEETWYLRDTEAFWYRVATAKGIIHGFEKEWSERNIEASPLSTREREMGRAVEELRKVLREEPFEAALLQQRIEDWKPSFIMGNLPSFLVILGLVYFLTVANRIRKNPLASIPGPEITKWTDLILKYYTVLGQRPRYVHALHEKYGPIVRVSPTEIDISDIPAAREIHRIASPYMKAPWYRLLNRKDGESMFSTTDPDYHRRHRRLLSSPLSDANLRTEMEPLVRARINLAIEKMKSEAASPRGVADIYKWFFFMATDIIGELSFGDSFRMLEIGTKNQYIADLETVAKIGGIRATFPFVMAVAGFLPLSIFKEVVESTDRIVSYATQSVERYKAHLAMNPDEAKTKPTLFTKLYGASQSQGKNQKNGEECLSDQEIRNDAQSFIIAGSDTTANTLTYLVWSVLRDENIRRKLIAELNKSVGEKELSDAELRELPYLNQVISEALRLYPAVPSALPRVVPDKGSTLAGYWLPSGATVTTQLYSLHRDPEVFYDPERYEVLYSEV